MFYPIYLISEISLDTEDFPDVILNVLLVVLNALPVILNLGSLLLVKLWVSLSYLQATLDVSMNAFAASSNAASILEVFPVLTPLTDWAAHSSGSPVAVSGWH